MSVKKPEEKINTDKYKKYLLLFGLREDYSLEELSASYRILAKLNHPDLNRQDNSLETMTDINEGYHFLKEAHSSQDFINSEKLNAGKRDKSSGDFNPEDIFYNQYKKGFIILKNSFELYYGEREDKSMAGNIEFLKKELLRAKIEFSTLINDLPYNQWINDAIDKINSINKWLN